MALYSRNGRSLGPREPQPTDLITRADAEAMARAAVEDQCVKICEFYMAQMPVLVAKMITQFWTAQTGQAPRPPQSPAPRETPP